nr:hypothetical protein CFP56_07490 [Quercus suber]
MPAFRLNATCTDSKDIILRLSQGSNPRYEGLSISVRGSFEFKFPGSRFERTSSLGNLETLPIEILQHSLLQLDLLSLLQLTSVSVRGSHLVESLLPLRRFLAAVGNFPLVLARAKILGLHSLPTLNAALRSERCVSWGAYGPFLHLLLVQRCYYTCLEMNQSLWFLTLPKIKKCFELSNRHLNSLPVMWSIPGVYGRTGRSRRKQRRPASVRAAKEIILKIYSTFEVFEQAQPLEDDHEVKTMKRCRGAPLEPISQDALTVDDFGIRGSNLCDGMGVVKFPSLMNGQIEHGHGCLGCEEAHIEYLCEEPNGEMLARMVPRGCRPEVYFSRVEYRSWSTTGLIEHAKSCHPASVELFVGRVLWLR